MKANELQIGDWVRVLPISRKVESHNSQVGALTRNVDNTISIEGGYFPSWKGWSVSEEYIEPIPLTAEVLEANGWQLLSNYEREAYYDPIGAFSLDFRNGLFRLIIHGNIVIIQYVHELQHALRLCGLSELADNFKV